VERMAQREEKEKVEMELELEDLWRSGD